MNNTKTPSKTTKCIQKSSTKILTKNPVDAVQSDPSRRALEPIAQSFRGLLRGDSRELLQRLPSCSVDSIVTDPPYELGIAGHSWDSTGVAFDVSLWKECLRVLKPGGHLLAFSGSRTYHRMACAIEDAGFEIRDQIMWVYGTGFKKAGGLKPAHEPIVVARRPFNGTEKSNVLQWGTGCLNASECRVLGPRGTGVWGSSSRGPAKARMFNSSKNNDYKSEAVVIDGQVARWPTNFIHDGSTEVVTTFPPDKTNFFQKCAFDDLDIQSFMYCAKPSKTERTAGLEEIQTRHPTLKPLTLLRYLLKLCTPAGGLVLDPFLGSGSSAVAAILEGFEWIGCELGGEDGEYWEVIDARVKWAQGQISH